MSREIRDDQYALLRDLAHRLLPAGKKQPVDPTDLVHECYLKLQRQEKLGNNEVSFRAYAAQSLRSILIDILRKEQARTGKAGVRITLSDAVQFLAEGSELDLSDLDIALNKLSTLHPRPARVIELRFFGGLTGEEVAQHLDITRRTMTSDWQFARSWLRRELRAAELSS